MGAIDPGMVITGTSAGSPNALSNMWSLGQADPKKLLYGHCKTLRYCVCGHCSGEIKVPPLVVPPVQKKGQR